jgi:predicted metal-dependent HD superfamily phosphohydrolase
MDLQVRWPLMIEAIGARGDCRRVFADLDRRYREPGRHYHTWDHVTECLAELDAAPGLCDRSAAVELALWFHDAVYDPRAADSEVRSAELLREAAAQLGIDADLTAASSGLVLATAHLAQPGSVAVWGRDPVSARDADAIRDIDLAILGSAPGRFDAYETAVRREYAFLSDSEWKVGRSRVLRAFLGRPRLYLTGAFHDRLETQARRNLAESLVRLG